MRETKTVLAKLLLIVLSIITLNSCTVISKDIDKSAVLDDKTFELNTTHYRDVIDAFGPPAKLSKYNKGLVFLYESIDINEYQIGVNFNYNILKLLKLSVARGTADREVLLLIFDKDGYLLVQKYDQFDENLGSGQAISYLFAIEQLVDSSKLEEPPSSLDWGQSLLEPIPNNLNYPQNLGTGESGLEQLGAPNNVGQHTLELEN